MEEFRIEKSGNAFMVYAYVNHNTPYCLGFPTLKAAQKFINLCSRNSYPKHYIKEIPQKTPQKNYTYADFTKENPEFLEII